MSSGVFASLNEGSTGKVLQPAALPDGVIPLCPSMKAAPGRCCNP